MTVDVVDLLIADAELVATLDEEDREIPGGWVALNDGVVVAVGGPTDPPPVAQRTIHAAGCLVTPGLVNTHHHIFQNLNRGWPAMTSHSLFEWMQANYPLWQQIDEDAILASTWVGLSELLLSGATMSTDMLYFLVRDRGDLLGASLQAAADVGIRFHPVRAAISTCGELSGDLLPDEVIWEPDAILDDCERLVGDHHDPSRLAMTRIAVGPAMTSLVSAKTTARLVEMAERDDLRLHTHIAESAADLDFAQATYGRTDVAHFESVGLALARTWAAHCVRATGAELTRLARAGVSIAHCPTSNLILGNGLAPVAAMRARGMAVGLGVDGSASNDSGSLWMEARQALLVGKLEAGPASVDARAVLAMATRGGAACLGRENELGRLQVGYGADAVVWDLSGLEYSSGSGDPIELWLRSGPSRARETVVAGRVLVSGGALVADWAPMAAAHRAAGRQMLARATRPMTKR